jgi:hypothetical protein
MLNDLEDILSKIYSVETAARRICAHAGIPLEVINFDGPIRDIWHDIVRQARLRGKLLELVKVAAEDAPLQPVLQRAYGALLYGEANVINEARTLSPGDNNKLDEMYRMVYEIRERVSVLRVWLVALTIGMIFAAILFGWRLS